jgi:hypothetical protein
MNQIEDLNKNEIESALKVLDQVSNLLLRVGAKRQDMLKENFRRDGLALNQAAQILEVFLDDNKLNEIKAQDE